MMTMMVMTLLMMMMKMTMIDNGRDVEKQPGKFVGDTGCEKLPVEVQQQSWSDKILIPKVFAKVFFFRFAGLVALLRRVRRNAMTRWPSSLKKKWSLAAEFSPTFDLIQTPPLIRWLPPWLMSLRRSVTSTPRRLAGGIKRQNYFNSILSNPGWSRSLCQNSLPSTNAPLCLRFWSFPFFKI